jgi:hypothetical protein
LYNYYINILSCTFNFLSIFISYTIVLSFWGGILLKIFKFDTNQKYGSPLTLTSGLLILVFFSWILYGFINIYKLLFYLYFYIGLLGIFIEIFYYLVFIFQKSKNKKTIDLFYN